jgi:hypothetical protein
MPRETRIHGDSRRRIGSRDLAIGELAGRQQGVVSRRQLRGLGLSASAIDHRVRIGRFESDRLRDRELAVAGWTPVRVTWRQLERDARRLEADLRVLLTSARRATP